MTLPLSRLNLACDQVGGIGVSGECRACRAAVKRAGREPGEFSLTDTAGPDICSDKM